MLTLSKALDSDWAAQISTFMPVIVLICSKIIFSRFISSTRVRSTFSVFTLTPVQVISIRQGSNANSRLAIPHKSSFPKIVRKYVHNSKVRTASISAYGPTCIAGSFQSSAFGSTPKSRAASVKAFSDLVLLR